MFEKYVGLVKLGQKALPGVLPHSINHANPSTAHMHMQTRSAYRLAYSDEARLKELHQKFLEKKLTESEKNAFLETIKAKNASQGHPSVINENTGVVVGNGRAR